jgi:hypothetical protein
MIVISFLSAGMANKLPQKHNKATNKKMYFFIKEYFWQR